MKHLVEGVLKQRLRLYPVVYRFSWWEEWAPVEHRSDGPESEVCRPAEAWSPVVEHGVTNPSGKAAVIRLSAEVPLLALSLTAGFVDPKEFEVVTGLRLKALALVPLPLLKVNTNLEAGLMR